MSDEPAAKYKIYYFTATIDGHLIRKDEGFPLAVGEYMVMDTRDFASLVYDLRYAPGAING